MGTGARTVALHVATWAGWLALLVSMTPWAQAVGFEMGRLGIAVGPTGSIILTLHRISVPVAQVFEVGRQAGRREAMAEPQPGERRLRVVEDA